MKKSLFFMAVMAIAFLFASCEGITTKPNLFVDLDEPEINSYLRYLSNVAEGANGHSGANLLDKQVGTITKDGRTYRTFILPRGTYDFYVEWDDPSQSDGIRVARAKHVPINYKSGTKLYFYDCVNNVGEHWHINTAVEWAPFNP